MVCDEFEHANPEAFFRVVLPMVNNNSVPVLVLSSPMFAESTLQQMITACDTHNNRVVYASKTELVCGNCRRAGEQLSCTHMDQYNTPSWKNPAIAAKIEALMKVFDPAGMSAENRGVAVRGGIPFFAPSMIKRLRALEYYELPRTDMFQQPPPIVIAVDPNSSGADNDANSEVGIAAVAYHRRFGFMVSLFFRRTTCTKSARDSRPAS